jgi:YfiH family protein
METIIEQGTGVSGRLSGSDDETVANNGFVWREVDGIKVLVCVTLEKAGFVNGFSTRVGGVSPFPENDLNLAGYDEDSLENIEENRRRFLNALGVEWPIATAWQVHGDNFRVVKEPGEPVNSDERADAVVSDLTGVLTGVKTADCVPILIGDRARGAFAAVHAGWRGTVRSIAAKAVALMTDRYGSQPADMVCAIGPAACGRSYEVGQEVIAEFAAADPESRRYFSPTREGHALVDLHLANHSQLTGAGIRSENISTAPHCTMERTDLFFSYRVEKKKYGRTGRLLSVIGRAA